MSSPTKSEQLFQRASAVTPGGVNSPVRAFKAVGGTPRFMARGQGPYLWDVDEQRYVDLVCSWGPMILGHRHPAVVQAVEQAIANGFTYGTPTDNEVLLAEEIISRVPSVDQVRLVSSGTEATMSAVRLARAATGRSVIVKFAGHYHGHVDALLASAGSGAATFALPDCPGLTGTDQTIVLPYNDIDALRNLFAAHGPEIACVITEACPGNMGVVAPAEGFYSTLRSLTRDAGALLISDEVMSGFRLSTSGWWGWSGHDLSEAPDLSTFGKVMGGGFPAAAFGGRRDLMGLLSPQGSVYQAGTLSGNPVATAAGYATLQQCTPQMYADLEHTATALAQAASAALTQAGAQHVVNQAGSMFSIFMGTDQVHDYASASRQNTAAYAAFFHAMLDQGVYLPPSAYECWFVSAAHDHSAIDQVTAAFPAAAQAAAQALDAT